MDDLTTKDIHERHKNTKWSLHYEDLIALYGYEIVVEKRLGSYQGEYVFVVKDGEQWGLAVISYGSCSGCDSFLAQMPRRLAEYNDPGDYEGVLEVAEHTRDQIRWTKSQSDLVELLKNKDWEGSYISWEMTETSEGVGYVEVNEIIEEVCDG